MPNYNGLIQAVQNVGPQIQEGFERGRARRYRNNLAGALQGGDYEQASQIAFGRGDIETGLGMQEQIRSQRAAQAEAQQQRQELYREATAEAAPAMMRIAEMEDPQQQQEALGVLTLTLQQRYPSIAQDIEQTAGQIFAGGPEAMRTAAQAMGAEVGSDVNLQAKTAINPETGVREYANFNPRTGEYEFTGVQAPESGQTINVEAPDIPGVTEAQFGQYRIGKLEEADQQLSTNRQLLDLVEDTRAQFEETGPGSAGIIGWARGAGQGAISQLDALAQYGEAGRQLAQYAEEGRRGVGFEDDANPSEFFNPELGGLELLLNTLAYRYARMLEPDGRLSDADVRNARVGSGPFGSEERILSALNAIERQARRNYERARTERNDLLNSAETRETPELEPRNRPIEDLSDEELRRIVEEGG